MRIGPDHVDVSDKSAVKSVLGGGKSLEEEVCLDYSPLGFDELTWRPCSNFYNAFTALRPNSFGVTDETVHATRRRSVANSFSAQSIAAMEGYIDEVVLDLIDRLDEKERNGKVVDLKKWISYCVVDILGELAFSKSFGVVGSKGVEGEGR